MFIHFTVWESIFSTSIVNIHWYALLHSHIHICTPLHDSISCHKNQNGNLLQAYLTWTKILTYMYVCLASLVTRAPQGHLIRMCCIQKIPSESYNSTEVHFSYLSGNYLYKKLVSKNVDDNTRIENEMYVCTSLEDAIYQTTQQIHSDLKKIRVETKISVKGNRSQGKS